MPAEAGPSSVMIMARRTTVVATILSAVIGLGTALLPSPASAAGPFTVPTSTVKVDDPPLQEDTWVYLDVRNTSGGALHVDMQLATDNGYSFGRSSIGGHACEFRSVVDPLAGHLEIPAGKTCEVELQFHAEEVQRYENSLSLYVGSFAKVVSLVAVVKPPLSFTPASYEFGALTVGGPAQSITVTYKNKSDQTLELAIAHDPGVDSSFYEAFSVLEETGSCTHDGYLDVTLKPGRACVLTITVATDQLGDHSFRLRPKVMPLLGDHFSWFGQVPVNVRGVRPGFTVKPGALDYGKVVVGTTSETKRITVKNTSTVSERIGVRYEGFADDSLSTVSSCGGFLRVAPGKTCSLRLAITPGDGGADHTRAVVFYLEDDNGDPVPGTERFVPVTLYGASPRYSMAPQAINFGNVTAHRSSLKVVTVKNTSKHDITVHLKAALLGPSMSLVNGTARCDVGVPRTLERGTECFLYVLFAPEADTGDESGVIRLDLLGADGVPIPGSERGAKLKGTTSPIAFTLSDVDVDYGFVRVGHSSAATITVTNRSRSSLSFVPELSTGHPSDFSLADGTKRCDLAVKPGAKCSYVVTFHPTDVLGEEYAQLTVFPVDSAGTIVPSSAQPVSFRGKGFPQTD